MNWGPAAISFVGLLVALPGCHNDPPCKDGPPPPGVQFEVTITALTKSLGCSIPLAAVGDVTIYSTGTPVDVGPNGTCLVQSMEPPAGLNPLYGVNVTGDCRSQPFGFNCPGSLVACAEQAAILEITVGLPYLTKPGQEGEGTHRIHVYAPATEGCPEVACQEEFTIHAKRLD